MNYARVVLDFCSIEEYFYSLHTTGKILPTEEKTQNVSRVTSRTVGNDFLPTEETNRALIKIKIVVQTSVGIF